ncbi:hypothetical protein DIPPA_04849 [Diplonema papillatum]|nr:hypothetical protein DIPPA_04849 [Diplonema papillatum]
MAGRAQPDPRGKVVTQSIKASDAARFWEGLSDELDWLQPHVEDLTADKLRTGRNAAAKVDSSNPIWLEAPLRRLQMQMQGCAALAGLDPREREEAVFREIANILKTWDTSQLKDPEQFLVSLQQVLKHTENIQPSAKVGGLLPPPKLRTSFTPSTVVAIEPTTPSASWNAVKSSVVVFGFECKYSEAKICSASEGQAPCVSCLVSQTRGSLLPETDMPVLQR